MYKEQRERFFGPTEASDDDSIIARRVDPNERALNAKSGNPLAAIFAFIFFTGVTLLIIFFNTDTGEFGFTIAGLVQVLPVIIFLLLIAVLITFSLISGAKIKKVASKYPVAARLVGEYAIEFTLDDGQRKTVMVRDIKDVTVISIGKKLARQGFHDPRITFYDGMRIALKKDDSIIKLSYIQNGEEAKARIEKLMQDSTDLFF
ncbi:MAG: hypothetical protein J6328_00005 [Bacilli bacterium]|nr:hypothetical protein [Bacilli bacterium]